MEKHIAIEIINDLGITNEDEDIIRSRVNGLSIDDAESLLDKMDTWYKAFNAKQSRGEASVLDIWIPSAPSESVHNITANLLLADSVILADPLYDQLALFTAKSASHSIFNLSTQQNKHICSTCTSKIHLLEFEVLRERFVEVIAFYLRSKPLIESGQLLPYVDPTLPVGAFVEAPLVDIFEKYDNDIARFATQQRTHEKQIKKLGDQEGHTITTASTPFVRDYIHLYHEKVLMLIALEQIITSPNSIPSPSIDFLGSLSHGVFKSMIRFYDSIIQGNEHQFMKPAKASLQPGFSIPTLAGIPIEELPEILLKEQDALEQFKSHLVSKIAAIDAPYGTKEWNAQIDHTRANFKKEIIELTRTLQHIKRDHLKRQIKNVFLLGFSMTLASLAIVHQTIDPISALQSVASGAGLTASLKDIVDSWIDYQDKISEQSRRDVCISYGG